MIPRFFLVRPVPDRFYASPDIADSSGINTLYLGDVLEISDQVYVDWSVHQFAYGDIDRCTLKIDDEAKMLTRERLAASELYVELWDRRDNWVRRVRRIFGGHITEIKTKTKGVGRVFECKALGWAYKLSNIIINTLYTPEPGDFISDKDIILGVGVPSLFDANDSVEEYEGLEPVLTLKSENIEVGIPNIGYRTYAFQDLRSVLDRLSGESGFYWRVTPERELIYRDRQSPFAVSLVGFSDEPQNNTEPTGDVIEFQLELQSVNSLIYRETSAFALKTFVYPPEVSWPTPGPLPHRVTGVNYRGTFDEWELDCNNFDFRSDVVDYEGLLIQFAHNDTILARVPLAEVLANVGTRRLVLQNPISSDDMPTPNTGTWKISFRREDATFEWNSNRVDTSKVKNLVRVFGGFAIEQQTQDFTIVTGEYNLPVIIREFEPLAMDPGDSPLLVRWNNINLRVVRSVDVPVDAFSYDFIWDEVSSTLMINLIGSWLVGLDTSIDNDFSVTGLYAGRVLGNATSEASIDAYGVRTLVIQAPEIETSAEADRRAAEELREWETGLEVLEVTTDREGFEVGTRVSVHSVVHGLMDTNPTFLIESIVTTSLAPNRRTHRIKMRRDGFTTEGAWI